MLLYRKRHIDHETGLFLRLTSLHFSANLEKEWQYSFFWRGGDGGAIIINIGLGHAWCFVIFFVNSRCWVQA